MARKSLILTGFLILLAAESVYFARASVAGLIRLEGRRAFFRNDHRAAWDLYQKAIRWGGDREVLEVDEVELILFGLDQSAAGIKIDLPFPPEQSIPLAHELIARRISETPRRAYYWSLASDIYAHEALRELRNSLIDISTLTEEFLQILLPKDRLSIAALRIASSLNPLNYTYQGFLVDKYLSLGRTATAATYCRQSVAAYPNLDSHRYLMSLDLAPEMLEAAVLGFEDALAVPSMVPRRAILYDAGRLMSRHGQEQRAGEYLRRVLEEDPDHFDALMEFGLARHRLGENKEAIDLFQRASRVRPSEPWPHYYSGVSRQLLGDLEGAARDFQQAREKGSGELKIFHAFGAALEAAGRMREAERQFAAAANLHPRAAEAWSALLAFQLRHNNVRAAEEVCAKLSSLRSPGGVSLEQCASLGRPTR